MKIFKDIITGDELFSDSFQLTEEGDIVYVIQSKWVVKEGGDYGIASNAGDGEGETAEAVDSTQEKVIDIVEAHRLAATPFDKKSFMAYIKGYMGKVKAHLHEVNPTREAGFMKAAAVFVKEVIAHFDDYTFYSGESCNPEAMYVMSKYEGESPAPKFYFFKDGVKGEEY
eukprot:TRINITY_DN18346_c0_g1_i1.p1 TRINITY_DN18346_c0_g1~~TRINITY_DN18346_c0_g1_i1.p1  ORF type:complete len:170 (-),score=76.12 TRINITY_DN18346_c0_g1_i1:45-554(-)